MKAIEETVYGINDGTNVDFYGISNGELWNLGSIIRIDDEEGWEGYYDTQKAYADDKDFNGNILNLWTPHYGGYVEIELVTWEEAEELASLTA